MRPDRFTGRRGSLSKDAAARLHVSHLMRPGAVRSGARSERCLLLRFATCLIALLLSAASLGPARSLEMDTLIGFGQSTNGAAHYRPESATPLTVYLTGQGARGVGQLQVSVRVGEHTTIYTRRVPLKDGPINESVNFTVHLRNSDGNAYFNPYGSILTEIQVQLLMDGRSLAGPKKLALPAAISLETYNVLAMTRDGSGLNLLNKKKLGLF